MEQLLHYCWKHKQLPLYGLVTTTGQDVEIIDVGLHNHDAGPDFFNAKVKIGGTMWVGNVEIHSKSGDWYLHGHDKDPRYDNVILHVVENANMDVRTSSGNLLPQVVIHVPEHIRDNYQELLSTDSYPPCYKAIPDIPRLSVHSWMSALVTERLERKTEDIRQRIGRCGGSWEDAFFVTLARSYGFGINSDAFETWAENIPLSCVGHHRDDIMQIEAIFLGQAGLLDLAAMPERYREEASRDNYYNRLLCEYRYLAHKFSLTPMNHTLWKFLRLHPQNFPQIRISQLASLYFSRRASLGNILCCQTVKELEAALSATVTPYWQTHYNFGQASSKSSKTLSRQSLHVVIINAVVPMLFAYGRYKGNDEVCARSFSLLEELKAEQNNIVKMWHNAGLDAANAADSQALIQLKKVYCDRKDCLRCRIGYEYLRKKTKPHPQ